MISSKFKTLILLTLVGILAACGGTDEITKKEIVTVQKNGISLKFDPNIVDTKEVDKFLSKIEK